jgi:hypothetical protein
MFQLTKESRIALQAGEHINKPTLTQVDNYAKICAKLLNILTYGFMKSLGICQAG